MNARTRRTRRYVAWIRRHATTLIAAHLLVLCGSIYLIAFRLPLLADFVYLLPQDAPAVRDMHKLEARVKANDTVLVVIVAPTPELRAIAATEMAAGISAVAPELVTGVDGDDAEARAFLRAHRHELVPIDDLVRARDALKHRIEAAKLEANPLYIDLEDHTDEVAVAKHDLEQLRTKRRDAERLLDRPSNVSADGTKALLQIRTPLRATDVAGGQALLEALEVVRRRVVADHPTIEIGYAGDTVTAIAEHRAIVNGTLVSSLVTTLLVGLVLALYFRSATLLILLIVTVAIATTAAFGAAAFTVGHLNAATAFLGAIIAGNGINYGILLIARYLEERRQHDVEHALAIAIAETLRPTAVAALGAAIAYGSLVATSFKGFADFAVIGAVGMVLCWIASFLLLPALMIRFGRNTRLATGAPVVGAMLVRLLGFRRCGVVLAIAAAVSIAAGALVFRYIAADPFEYDMRQLGSEGDDAVTERAWMKVSDLAFGRGYAGRTFIAADRHDQVPLIVAELRARDAGKPLPERTIGSIDSILDVVPEQPGRRTAVLDDIRRMLDDTALDALDDDERRELAGLRPPTGLVPLTLDALPPSIRNHLAEKDGRIGLLISIRPSELLDELDGHDVIRFANTVSRLDLPNGETVTTSGASVIFANILETIARDGPIVTLTAAVGLVVMVLLLVGLNRRAMAVLVATGAGSLLMVAACALLGLKVNFLDFVALPITLGLGIDYAINVAHRHDHDAVPDPISALRTTGAAVFVCSLTTMIGYGSLLVSQNLAIRGFGMASLIGEVTTVSTALILVPALLSIGRTGSPPRDAGREVGGQADQRAIVAATSSASRAIPRRNGDARLCA